MSDSSSIPFNKPFISKLSKEYMLNAYSTSNHCGNKYWAKRAIDLMKSKYNFGEVFLTPSCTSALEMGALLLGINQGDEVILPSYTFSSTATSIMLMGAKPIFCDVEPNSMNIDPNKIEGLITNKTKLILPIDYAGVSSMTDKIKEISSKYSIPIMVDSAQSYGSKDSFNRSCGTLTELATFSFHETKNLTCGEGGALIVNDKELIDRAYILQEKGTDRKKVLDGISSKYKWVDKGSSYLLSDILSAILCGQLEEENYILSSRAKVTQMYKNIFDQYDNIIKRIDNTNLKSYNHHAYYLILDSKENRKKFIDNLRLNYNIYAYIGYSPLHSSPMGLKLGYKPRDLPITEDLGNRIVRLPLYVELGQREESLKYLQESISKTMSIIYN